MARHLDHDVVGFQQAIGQVFAVAAQALVAAGAAGQDLGGAVKGFKDGLKEDPAKDTKETVSPLPRTDAEKEDLKS